MSMTYLLIVLSQNHHSFVHRLIETLMNRLRKMLLQRDVELKHVRVFAMRVEFSSTLHPEMKWLHK